MSAPNLPENPSDPTSESAPPPPSSTGPYGGAATSGGLASHGAMPTQTTDASGFFRALFDFSFTEFITPKIVKLVYILATVVLILGWFVFMVAAFSQSALAGLFVLVVGAIGVIVYLALIRMTLEFYLSIVRMSEDIHRRLPPA